MLTLKDVAPTEKGKLYLIYKPLPNNTKIVDVFHGVKAGNAEKVMGMHSPSYLQGAFMVIGSKRKREVKKFVSIFKLNPDVQFPLKEKYSV